MGCSIAVQTALTVARMISKHDLEVMQLVS